MKDYRKKLMFVLIFIVINIILGGFVFQLLWNWFIITTFDVKELTLIQAVGINFILDAMQARATQNEQNTIDKTIDDLLYKCGIYGFTMLIGQTITLFM